MTTTTTTTTTTTATTTATTSSEKATWFLFALISLYGWSIVQAFVPTTMNELLPRERASIASGVQNKCYTTPTILYQATASSSSDNDIVNDDNSSDNDDNETAAFMTALRSRMDVTKQNRMPLVVLDSMLPRQELNITIRHPALLQLIQDRIANESPFFCMLGLAKRATSGTSNSFTTTSTRSSEYVHLQYGVQVQIVQCQITPGQRVSVHLRADQLLRVKGDTVNKVAHGDWTDGQVEVLDPSEEERVDNTLRLAHAMWKARQLDQLVQEWISLAKRKERMVGQVDAIVQRLGRMPTAEQPSDRAFWVGALINPIPALGVAMEIRPALLLAQSPNERIDIVLAGIIHSIGRLKQQQQQQ